jgi:hypothetical protein
MLVVFGLSMVIFFLIARRVLQGKLLLGIMALVLTNFWLLDNSSIVMSELTFMLCLLAGYLLLVRFEETDIIKFMGFAGLLFILSVFVRTIGISVFLTVFAYLILKKQYRLLAGLTLAFVVLYFVNKSFMQPKSNYLTDLFKVNPYQPHLGSVGFVGFFKRIWDNTLFYMGNVIQMTLFSFMSELVLVDKAAVIALTVVFTAILFAYPPKRLWESHGDLFLRAFLIIYMGVLFVWPRVWSGSRFVVPIIPFLYLVAFQNIAWLVNRYMEEKYKMRLQGLILAISLVWALMNFSSAYKKTHEPLSEDWVSYFELAGWTKENVKEDAIFCARKPFLWHLKSNKLCVPIPFSTNPYESWKHLRDYNVQYVVIDKFKWTGSTQRYVVPLINNSPEKFDSLVTKGKDKAGIFRVKW